MNAGNLKKMACRSIAIVMLSSTAGLTSCGKPSEVAPQAQFASENEAIDFPEWCRSYDLQNCDVRADDSIPVDQWRAGVDVFSELMQSLTSILLTRADFDRKTVQQLFTTFGANSLLSFISKIPWQRIEKIENALVLRNAPPDALATFNGLQLIGSERVVAKFVGAQVVSISGLEIADAHGGNVRQVKALDLSKPSRMTIVTNNARIRDIPIQFFQVPGFRQPPTLTPSAAFNAIADVVLEPGFDWRTNLSIFLKGNNLGNIYSRVRDYIPQGPADDTTRQVIANTDTFMVGGERSNILISMQMEKPLVCVAKVRDVPILGSIEFEINFLKGFGLTDLERLKADSVRTKVYGISTSVGTISSIEVDARQMRLHVGAFNIPLDFVPSKPDSKGPAVDHVQCR